MNQPKIIFCLPGESFSGRFLDAWTELIILCSKNGIPFWVSRRESPVIYYVRNACLGGDTLRGEQQKPFDGKLDYTHLMWIDSDVIFTPDQFVRLINYDKDIVSGIYKMSDGVSYATVEKWDEEYFKGHGNFQFMQDRDFAGRRDLIEVAYSGFGFMLIKRGVFESLPYPWFRPIFHHIGTAVDFSAEDASFCITAREKGFKILVDPGLKVGHEKMKVIL